MGPQRCQSTGTTDANGNPLPHGESALGYAPLEYDTIESFGGGETHQGTLNWSYCDCGITAFEINDVGNYISGFSTTQSHSYGQLNTGDIGAGEIQTCGYVDNVLISTNDLSIYRQNCFIFTVNSRGLFWSGQNESRHFYQPDKLSIWVGGTNGDPDLGGGDLQRYFATRVRNTEAKFAGAKGKVRAAAAVMIDL
jgi:hypothetical protein